LSKYFTDPREWTENTREDFFSEPKEAKLINKGKMISYLNT